ncbi:MAG TPA: hypothetical protein V6D22_03625 [Candidatus Obscuribacterales bacterium]
MLPFTPETWDALDWIFGAAMLPVIALALLLSFDSLFPRKRRYVRH